MRIRDVIDAVVAEWHTSPEEVNDGNCEGFALEISNRVPEAIPIWDYETYPKQEEFDGAHCFIEYRGRYYDSEMPDGVKNWRQLPCFLRERRLRRHILSLKEAK